MNPRDAKKEFDNATSHIEAAYRFFADCIPRPEQITAAGPLRIGRFEFQKPSQAKSMEVELAWAFFTRFEAAFEALTLRLDLTFKSAYEKLQHSGQLGEEDLRGLRTARELRNIFHHGDGDADLLRKKPGEVQLDAGHEPHLDEQLMDQFVLVFRNAADVLTRPALRSV